MHAGTRYAPNSPRSLRGNAVSLVHIRCRWRRATARGTVSRSGSLLACTTNAALVVSGTTKLRRYGMTHSTLQVSSHSIPTCSNRLSLSINALANSCKSYFPKSTLQTKQLKPGQSLPKKIGEQAKRIHNHTNGTAGPSRKSLLSCPICIHSLLSGQNRLGELDRSPVRCAMCWMLNG
jgi:hypothetical protein